MLTGKLLIDIMKLKKGAICMKNIKKTPIIVIGVTLAIVAAVVLPIVLFGEQMLISFAEALFGPTQVSEEDKYVYFDDGSVLERHGGPTYTHFLFDDYELVRVDSRFESYLYNKSTCDSITDQGYIVRYSFDPSGYIAYRYLENDYDAQTLYEWDGYSVSADITALYNCKTGETTEFESVNELNRYCDEKGIETGEWYYPVGYSSLTAETILELNNWTVKSNVLDYCVVSNGNEELFSGEIDKYFYEDGYFGFHFQFVQYGDYGIAQNPVITYTEDTVVGKEYKGLGYFFVDVYVDCYVFVDTSTGEYKIFDIEKQIENHAEENGIDVHWQTIESD